MTGETEKSDFFEYVRLILYQTQCGAFDIRKYFEARHNLKKFN